ncbi:MAG: hypothetical protein ACRDQG_14260 [Pseudonocardiaceae bacterium]
MTTTATHCPTCRRHFDRIHTAKTLIDEQHRCMAVGYAYGRFDSGTGAAGADEFGRHYAAACHASGVMLDLKTMFDGWIAAARERDEQSWIAHERLLNVAADWNDRELEGEDT